MKNFMEGVFIPQPGEDIKDNKVINARIKAENKEIGIHEISQKDIDEMEEWDDEKLERLARAIVYIQEKRRKKLSN